MSDIVDADDFEENGDDENATADQPEYEDLDQQDELEDLEIEPEGDLAENEEDDNEEDESDQDDATDDSVSDDEGDENAEASDEDDKNADADEEEGEDVASNDGKNRKRKRLTHKATNSRRKKLKNGSTDNTLDENGHLENGDSKNANGNASSSDSSDEENSKSQDTATSKTTNGEKMKKRAKKGKKKRKTKNKAKKNTLMRRNIRNLITDENLTETTKEARAEEAERLRRLMMGHQSVEVRPPEDLLQAVSSKLIKRDNTEGLNGHELAVIHISSSDEAGYSGVVANKPTSNSCPDPHYDSDSDVKILSDDQAYEQEEEEQEEDHERLGLHVDDRLNVPEEDGRIQINKGHPPEDDDIFLAPQFQGVIKPHQVGGVRFLFDNIIESPYRFNQSNGFGCILAHSMGLGKTLQLVAFSDIFLRHTPGKRVLCIVPINTIQNWMSEYNHWTPSPEDLDPSNDPTRVRPRNFQLHLLNDSLKNLEQRTKVILNWKRAGGVLLMGYELYRLLATRTQRKKRKAKKVVSGPVCIDIEEEDKEKYMLDEIYKLLVNPGPDLVICDEGHRIKNSHASISQALKSIRTKRRVVLTGYPLQNNLIEYWCMVDFVRPNYLGTRTEFSNMFERPIQNGQCVDSTPRDSRLMMHRVHVLHQQLMGFVQRRGHAVLRLSLPPKREYVLLIRMTSYQRMLYRLFMEELISHRSVSNPLRAFAICCKIWNHPDVLYNFVRAKEEAEDLDFEMEELAAAGKPVAFNSSQSRGRGSPKKKISQQMGLNFDPESSNSNSTGFVNIGPGFSPFSSPLKRDEMSYDWASGCFTEYVEGQAENSHKLVLFLDILEETIKVGDRLLLFSQSLFTLTLIEDFLKRRQVADSNDYWCPGVNYFRLDGSTPAMERERLINAFNRDFSVKLFLVSTRAGSLGINLVGANRVIVFDASWNPCHDSQAVCRVYRYGQKKISHIYRFVTDNSLEKKIYDRQVNKQGMADRVVDDSNPEARLSTKEIQRLICDDEDDPPPNSWNLAAALEHLEIADPVLAKVIGLKPETLSEPPFTHESLLVDRKEKKLSKAEKRMAVQNFEMEKEAKISYTRPSYTAFYPKEQGTTVIGGKDLGPSSSRGPTNNLSSDRYYPSTSQHHQHASTSSSNWPNNFYSGPPAGPSTSSALRKALEARYFAQNQTPYPGSRTNYSQSSTEHPSYPVPQASRSSHQHPVQQPIPPYIHKSSQQNENNFGNSSSALHATSRFPMEALSKAKDVIIQEVALETDMAIPTNNGDPPMIMLKKGQQVMFIRTPKGMYLRLGEKIIKIKLSPGMLNHLRSTKSSGAGSAPDPPPVVTLDSSSESESENTTANGQQPNQQQLPQEQHKEKGEQLLEEEVPVHIEDLQVTAEDFPTGSSEDYQPMDQQDRYVSGTGKSHRSEPVLLFCDWS